MQFFLKADWQHLFCVVIVLGFCFGIPVSAQSSQDRNGDRSAQAETADSADGEVRKQVTSLQASLAKTEQELADLRRRYAKLYLRAQEQARTLRDLRLRVAGWVQDAEDIGDADALATALTYLSDIRQDHRDLYEAVRAFAEYLQMVLDIVQPSDVLRQEITTRYDELVKHVDRLERMPSLVAGQGNEENRRRRECRVLAVNDQLQLVVLDIGADDGVRAGQAWRVKDSKRRIAGLKVIETRSRLSAAIVVEGTLKNVAPGMTAVRSNPRW